ncbi:MAG: hypothetical protein H0U60_02485 [Blastocatellia bacterium]|nr:hypothetical protein [Blastocatellia bacterium]
MANTNAYGFINMADLFAQRVQSVGPQRVYDAVALTAAEYTRVMDALLAEWVAPVTNTPQIQYELPGTGTLQPLDSEGNPMPVLPSGSYTVGFPIQGGGTAWGTNRVTRALLTVEEAARFTTDALQRDKDWVIRHVLAALLTNVTWTYTDNIGAGGSKGLGSLTIQPLANADSVVYGRKGFTASATNTHFLAQAAAIADATNPYPTIFTELSHHPSNGSRRVVAYIASDLVATTKALLTFIPTDSTDVIPAASAAISTNAPDIGVGDRVLGTVGGVWIVEWSAVPSGYIIAKVEGGSPLGMREYPVPELQGFFPEAYNVDGNHMVNRMIRYAGFGALDRVAALVMRIGNGTYAVPTGFLAPLPV